MYTGAEEKTLLVEEAVTGDGEQLAECKESGRNTYTRPRHDGLEVVLRTRVKMGAANTLTNTIPNTPKTNFTEFQASTNVRTKR